MKQHMERVQAAVALAIVVGFYGMAMTPGVLRAMGKGDFQFDPGILETAKNVMLILVGFLFGNAVKRDAASPPAPPAFAETQPSVKDIR